MQKKNIGKVEAISKVWLSKKEVAAYMGVSERFIEENINKRPDVDIYRLSGKCFLYNKDNLDTVIRRSRI